MNEQTDSQLLGDWAETRSEPAFAELVRRHVDFVYSAALRMVCDSHLAQDVTQSVFVALAKGAGQLADRRVLSGWLHRTAQNIAAQTVRTDVRRRAREQEAAAMNQLLATEPEAPWELIGPHLDAALGELTEPDRDAVLLRYFENKSLREVGQVLDMSDDAAQKRISRAVERLREFFAKRGVTVGTSGLVVVISANAVQAAPIGLAVTISTATAIAGTTFAATATATATKAIAMTTLQKTVIAATLAATGVAVPIWQQTRINQMTGANRELQAQADEVATLRQELQQLQKIQPDRNQATGSAATHLAVRHFDWRMVESEDYRKYIANLRAVGCPEETIRDIVVADVNKVFESRMKALRSGNTNRYEYWRQGNAGYSALLDADTVAKTQALAKEKRAALKELLGAEVPEKLDAWPGLNPFKERMDFLTDEKQADVMEIEQELTARQAQNAQAAAKGDYAELKRAYEERDAKLAQILTPEEKFEYDLRTSPTAMRMKNRMGGFEPTEQEFREIFKLWKQFDDEFGIYGGLDKRPEQVERRKAAQREMDDRLKIVLGEQRYQAYKHPNP